MDVIVLSSGSDSESEIEIVFSKPSEDILILENDSKRRRVECPKKAYSITEDYGIRPEKKTNKSPKIVEVCSIKSVIKCDKSIQEYFCFLLNKSYVIKNLKYEEYLDEYFSDELFSKFSCLESSKNIHYLTLFIPWIRIAGSKSINLSELLILLENFYSFGTSLGQKSTDNYFFCEFLIKFSQCINLISLKTDDYDQNKIPSQKDMAKFNSTKMQINHLISKMFKSLRRTNFNVFLTFFKIVFDIYRAFRLFLFKVKNKSKNNPFSLINFFKSDENFFHELLDHFKWSVLFFEKNIEFV